MTATARLIFQNDVIELRDIVEREVGNLDAAIASCTSHIDAATLDSWQQARAMMMAWVARVNAEVASVLPSGSWGDLYTQGRGLEAVMRENWWPRLSALGCVLPFAQPHAPREPGFSSDTPGSPLAMLASLEGLAKALLLMMAWREFREWTR